jgi:hypothetical protein
MGWSIRFDVKLRSGMEISYLVMQFMQNHDRILPETIIRVIFDESWEILDQTAGDSNSVRGYLGSSDWGLSHCKRIELIEEDRGFGLLS